MHKSENGRHLLHLFDPVYVQNPSREIIQERVSPPPPHSPTILLESLHNVHIGLDVKSLSSMFENSPFGLFAVARIAGNQ